MAQKDLATLPGRNWHHCNSLQHRGKISVSAAEQCTASSLQLAPARAPHPHRHAELVSPPLRQCATGPPRCGPDR